MNRIVAVIVFIDVGFLGGINRQYPDTSRRPCAKQRIGSDSGRPFVRRVVELSEGGKELFQLGLIAGPGAHSKKYIPSVSPIDIANVHLHFRTSDRAMHLE